MTTAPPHSTHKKQHLLRVRHESGHARVGFIELFFDLVFVFAVTQLSHLLLHHLTPGGALQSLLLLVAVWWAWIYTTWVTNWLDPETTHVRLLLFALMLLGLIIAAAIPKAFDERALWFALAYVAMQVGRTLYTMWVMHGQDAGNYRNFQRIAVWFAISGALWIGGALIGGPALYGFWIGAIALELVGPSVGFWVPGGGRSSTADWNIAGGHLAERCGLFVIIGLGESILLTGATFSELNWTAANLFSFVACVIGSIAMWWIYFNVGAERASRLIAASPNPGALGRLAYTYIHLLIVAGIIASAASDEIVLMHPADALSVTYATVIIGGPFVFLLGCLLFKWVTAGRPPFSHILGLALLALWHAFGRDTSVAMFGNVVAAVLVLVAIWETWSLRHEIARTRANAHGHAAGAESGGHP